MTPRAHLEQRELNTLMPYATFSAHTKGRMHAIAPCDMRTEFQRDRDRIQHSKAFRRLKYKTQVFLSPQGDHFRTRLTHTLDVSQIARTITRALMLNEDLAEAIAMGHDLGHAPFGHMGERALDACYPGGFSHNAQSLRVVDTLEKDGEGLNLTCEVRDGIVHHSGETHPSTLEGCAVRWADRIAYLNHDLDDALRAGLLVASKLPKNVAGTHSTRIDSMIRDVITHSAGHQCVEPSPQMQNILSDLREFLFANVYHAPWAEAQEARVSHTICDLYAYFTEHQDALPDELSLALKEGAARASCDYVAGMTDRFAINTYERLFMPTAFGE